MRDEVLEHLAFVLERTNDRDEGTVPNAAHLLNLSEDDSRRIAAVHILTSDLTVALAGGLPQALRSLPRTSEYEQVVSRTGVRGPVNWPATLKARAAAGLDPSLFVTTPPFRAFDVLETQLIRTAVHSLDELLLMADVSSRGAEGSWQARLDQAERASEIGHRNWVLMAASPLTRPWTVHLARARATRYSYVRDTVVPWLAQYVQLFSGTALNNDDLEQLLSRTAFLSTEKWHLFELLVLFRLLRHFAGLANQLSVGLVAPGRPDLFARLRIADDTIELRYQRQPNAPHAPDLVRPALRWYGLPSDIGTPDIVLERVAARRRRLIVELKDSRSLSYLADGMYQLWGYTSSFDEPDVETLGALVAWSELFERDGPPPEGVDQLNGLRASTPDGIVALASSWLLGD